MLRALQIRVAKGLGSQLLELVRDLHIDQRAVHHHVLRVQEAPRAGEREVCEEGAGGGPPRGLPLPCMSSARYHLTFAMTSAVLHATTRYCIISLFTLFMGVSLTHGTVNPQV